MTQNYIVMFVLEIILQCDSDEMSEWSTTWQMPCNTDKCRYLHVGHKYPSVNYSISGVEIKNAKAEKYLGVAIGCTSAINVQKW